MRYQSRVRGVRRGILSAGASAPGRRHHARARDPRREAEPTKATAVSTNTSKRPGRHASRRGRPLRRAPINAARVAVRAEPWRRVPQSSRIGHTAKQAVAESKKRTDPRNEKGTRGRNTRSAIGTLAGRATESPSRNTRQARRTSWFRRPGCRWRACRQRVRARVLRVRPSPCPRARRRCPGERPRASQR